MNWMQDAGTYPIIGVISFALCVMVFEWGHALNAPDVHIGKGDRNTLDYVETTDLQSQPKPGLRTEETLTSSKCIVLFFFTTGS